MASTAENYQQTYDRLCAHAREVAILSSTQSLLGWDERTKLPPAAGEYRAEQMSYLAGVIHKKQTAPEVGEWLAELADSPLAADPHSDAGADIVNLRRDYDRKTKLPQSLVEELAKLSVLGQQLWVEARKANDFARFRPLLERMVELKRQEAAAIGYDDVPYDALLDEYEPGAKTAEVARVLAGLREQLVPLVAEIAASRRRPNLDALKRQLSDRAAGEVRPAGGRGDRLRLPPGPARRDRSPVLQRHGAARRAAHDALRAKTSCPARCSARCTKRDTAFTSRACRRSVTGCRRAKPCRSASTNRSRGCGRISSAAAGRSGSTFFRMAQATFPDALGDVSLDDFYFAINDVRPSLIRTESDEATYNLHILVRFELEQALLEDDLRVADLPAAWNAKYREYLGIESPTDADGVLQDVHWSARRDWLLSHVLAGQSLRGPTIRSGRARSGRFARHVPPRRIPSPARLASQAHPLARPPLSGC